MAMTSAAKAISIYFSLPFTPVRNPTFFYNGHLALGIGDTVYQLFNPDMLKSPFLVSKMPTREWLFGSDRRWSHNEKTDHRYSSVYLYGKGEAYRTKVYQIEIPEVPDSLSASMAGRFEEIERSYQENRYRFDPLRANCSTAVCDALEAHPAFRRARFDFLPALAFRNLLDCLRAAGHPHELSAVTRREPSFRVHRICLGFFPRSAERYFDRRLTRPIGEFFDSPT